jgi:hypothetical protein
MATSKKKAAEEVKLYFDTKSPVAVIRMMKKNILTITDLQSFKCTGW